MGPEDDPEYRASFICESGEVGRFNNRSMPRAWGPIISSLCFALAGFVPNVTAQEVDPLILELIGQISDSSYTNSIQRLQAFSTRYELSDSVGPAGQWLYDQFIAMGYTEVAFDSFTWIPAGVDTPVASRNIVATKMGDETPESLVIIGGHYDSWSFLSDEDPNAPAPGANDNASGVAGVLEIARLLKPHSFQKTLVFACFAGEEMGIVGSSHYAGLLLRRGDPVRFSLIVDMIGYRELPATWDVIIDAQMQMDYVEDALRTARLAFLYSPYLRPRITFGDFGSDAVTLGGVGPAVAVLEEAGYSDPLFHRPWDVLDSLDIAYATEILKMALASVVDAAEPSRVGIGSSNEASGVPSPAAVVLHLNYPNPFNPTTTISFDLVGEPQTIQRVALDVYDLRGRHVVTLVDEELASGTHEVVWDGRDRGGRPVPSGVYIYSLRAGARTITRKMTLLR